MFHFTHAYRLVAIAFKACVEKDSEAQSKVLMNDLDFTQ